MHEQIELRTRSFVQQLLIEAPNLVLDFHVMKPGMVLAFLELLIKLKRQANNQNNGCNTYARK